MPNCAKVPAAIMCLAPLGVINAAAVEKAKPISLPPGTTRLNVGNAVHYAVGSGTRRRAAARPSEDSIRYRIAQGDLPLYADGTAMVVIGLVGESILAITDPGDVSAGPTSTKRPIEITGGWGRLMQSIDHISEELDPTRPGSLLANIKVSAQHIEHLTESIRGQMDPDNPLSLMARAQESMDAFAETASAMRQELDPDEPMSAISQISDVMLGIDSLLADASPKISDTLQSLSVLLERLDDYARVDLAEILWQLRQSNENLGRTTDNFAQLSERARDIVDRTSVSMNQTMDNVALTSSNLRGASAEIRRNPGDCFTGLMTGIAFREHPGRGEEFANGRRNWRWPLPG